MNSLKNMAELQNKLSAIDSKINQLNDQKITAFFDALGLTSRNDVPKDYLNWETILIIVPNRTVSNELKQYKFLISRITFATNINAKEIHIFNFAEWKTAFRNKTQLQIRIALKNSFGGVRKLPEEYNKNL